MEPIPLGPFEIVGRLGSGGMAEVWRGLHRGDELPVAIKVLGSWIAGRRGALQAFRNELRAVAGLDHPGIVRIFDHGVVSEELAEASDGLLHRGAPYLVMELATGASLHDWLGRLSDWPQQRRVLLQVLSALGHAHARGVVHRDLKPGNILRMPDRTWKLADFGIAHAFHPDHDEISRQVAGTPRYMAPEQMEGRWRDYGPWTDLYAVGCLAWRMATGQALYEDLRGMDLYRAVVGEGLPTPHLLPGVPAGLAGWLAEMLQVDPERRIRLASDATAALQAVEPGSGAQPPWALPERCPIDPPADAPLLGATGLLDVRQPPMVGRERERELLWQALVGVARERSPRVVVLRGSAGVGKARLVQWLVESATEGGVRLTVRIPHDGPGESTTGIQRAIVDTTRAWDLEGEALAARLARYFGNAEAEAVLAVAQGTASEGAGFGAALRGWTRRASSRPWVLWVDAAHWASDALAFVRWAVARLDPPQVLVVLTVRDEDEAVPATAASLDAIRRLPICKTVDVDPLDPTDARRLLDATVRLAPDARSALLEQAGGNPLFTLQLVRDAIERGALTEGPRGFVLEGEPVLPASLSVALTRRLERVLAGTAPEVARALEAAAVLGPVVRFSTWGEVCDADADPRRRLLDALLERRLVRLVDGGWAFIHPLLATVLVRRAAGAGRLGDHHARCAAVLRSRATTPADQVALGVHELGAGRPEAAIGPLMAGAGALQHRDAVPDAWRVLRMAREAMERAGRPESDPEWIDLHIRLASLAALQGLYPEVERLCAAVRHSGAAGARERVRVGLIDFAMGPPADRVATGRALVAEATDLGDVVLVARSLLALADALAQAGDLDGALALLADIHALAEPTGRGVSHALDLEAEVLEKAGRLDDAEDRYVRALSRWRAAGDRFGTATTLHKLGRLRQRTGDARGAVECLAEATSLFEEMGHPEVAAASLSAGLARLAAGDLDGAARSAERGLYLFRVNRAGRDLAIARLAMLPSVARTADPAAIEFRLRECLETLGWRVDAPVAVCLGALAEALPTGPLQRRVHQYLSATPVD